LETKHFTTEQLTERYSFLSKFKGITLGVALVGLLFVGLGYAFGPSGDAHHHEDGEHHEEHHGEDAGEHHSAIDADKGLAQFTSNTHDAIHEHKPAYSPGLRTAANFLLANVYVLTLALGALFFIAIHRAGNAGWHIAVHRIAEAMSIYLPFALLGFLIIYFVGADLYEWRWLSEGIDGLIDKKRAYLNESGLVIRTIIFFAGWTFAAWMIRQQSRKQDEVDGLEASLAPH